MRCSQGWPITVPVGEGPVHGCGCPTGNPCAPTTGHQHPPTDREYAAAERMQPRDDAVEAACAWSDYRSAYGVGSEELGAAHKAFLAGWKARGEGDQSGVLR